MIVIDGNIGSGKSTVLEELQRTNKFHIITEKFVFGDNNPDPILPKFYGNPTEYGMAVQLKILVSHMENINTKTDLPIITERSPLSCIHVFGELLLNEGNLNEEEQAMCADINRRYGWMPSHIIYIRAAPEICYDRIHNRGRDYEKESIKLSYLELLHSKYEELYMTGKLKQVSPNTTMVHVIDASRDFSEVYADVMGCIRAITS